MSVVFEPLATTLDLTIHASEFTALCTWLKFNKWLRHWLYTVSYPNDSLNLTAVKISIWAIKNKDLVKWITRKKPLEKMYYARINLQLVVFMFVPLSNWKLAFYVSSQY